MVSLFVVNITLLRDALFIRYLGEGIDYSEIIEKPGNFDRFQIFKIMTLISPLLSQNRCQMKIEIFKLITIMFLAGSIFAIMGVLIDNTLYRLGIARKMRVPTIVGAYLLAFIKVFAYTEISWFMITFIYVLGALFVVHQWDLWYTRNRGRWWWRSED